MRKNSSKQNELGLSVIYQYGMGEFGWTFFLSLISYYLLFYMTDVLLLPVAFAGILYSVVQWVEAATSIGAGVLIDNVHLRRGRYRPWLLIGSVICLIGTVVFFTNFHLTTTNNAIIFTVFYCISYAGYNCMWIAYRALIGLIGKDSQQTVALTISGTQLSTVASLIYSYVSVRLLTAFAKTETGYTVSAFVYCLIMIVCMLIVFRATKPYDSADREVRKQEKEKEHVSAKDMLRSLPPIIPYMISYILSIGASTLLFSMLIYYFKYVVQNPGMMTTLISVMTVVRFLATFTVRRLAMRFDKKMIYIVSIAVATVFMLLTFLTQSNTICFFVFISLYFVSLVPAGAMFMPCISDAADYNEYCKGIKARSFIISVASTLSYISQFIGATTAAVGLVVIGYDPIMMSQSSAVTSGITMVTFLGTAILTALSIIPMLFYKLNKNVMDKVYTLKQNALENETLKTDEME